MARIKVRRVGTYPFGKATMRGKLVMLGLALIAVGLIIVVIRFLLSLAPLLILAGVVVLVVAVVKGLWAGRGGRGINKETFDDWS